MDGDLYGTFAEIGVGQETVRHFFRAGGASQTIAKAMSAYDKDFSNAIYGKEPGNRFVCESRLKNMLRHEFGLINERLNRTDHPSKKFFTFANTVVLQHMLDGIQYALKDIDADAIPSAEKKVEVVAAPTQP